MENKEIAPVSLEAERDEINKKINEIERKPSEFWTDEEYAMHTELSAKRVELSSLISQSRMQK